MGVTTDTLTVMNTGNEDEGDYRCVVTDVVGDSITSNEATLTVGKSACLCREGEGGGGGRTCISNVHSGTPSYIQV